MSDSAVDNKLVKRHYPNTNNEQELSFIFEADPNLCMLKNKIAIHFLIELDAKFIPDNGFAAKQFSNVYVELNSQKISNNKSSGEYWLNDWMLKYGNLNPEYVLSLYEMEGYFDKYCYDELDENEQDQVLTHRRLGVPFKDGKYIYELIMTPNESFLNENHTLPPGIEMKLTFDRLPAQFSCLGLDNDKSLHGKTLELKDAYAQVEYISSPILRSYFDQRDILPTSYSYDEISVICRSVPKNEQYIRLENIRGGNTPDYVFFGLLKSKCLNGSLDCASINFQNNNVKEVNLTLNGNSCLGYPMRIQNDYPIWAYHKYHATLGKLMDSTSGSTLKLHNYKNYVIYAHKFEGEDASQGWLGVTFSLSKPLTEQYTLVMWTVQNVRASIDKYNQIDKFNL